MATRKPKALSKEAVITQEGTGVRKELADGTVIVIGSHLTVTTFPDGKTELKWDDEALVRDVRSAITQAESGVPTKAVGVSKNIGKRTKKVESVK
jgi:S-adenosylmethionine/arginine decarboxylase-like enzyme